MFDALKNLLADITGDNAEPREFAETDYRLAAAALLVHVADIDGTIDAEEQQRLRVLVKEKFALDAGATARLIAEATRIDRDAVDLYHFTSVLKRALDRDGRLKVVEMMWDIAYADGHVLELEENVVWRVAELLGVSSHERIALRQRVAARSTAATETDGNESRPQPWGSAETT